MRSGLRTLLVEHRELIEQRTLDVFLARSEPAPPESALQRGIPIFMEQLVETLSRGDKDDGKTDDSEIAKTASDYGQRLFGLGFTVSELVHGYGSVCAVVTELAGEVGLEISASEFEVFNRVLDVAIAESVTAHEYARSSETAQRESVRIGSLAHELRNALSGATMALSLLKEGTVGARGPTADVLDRNLARMGALIDRSLAEVRLGKDPDPVPERFRLADALEQIRSIAQSEANRRELKLVIDVDRALELETDVQFFMSAVSNLVQNALKYTREGSHVFVRGHRRGGTTSSSRWRTSVEACLRAGPKISCVRSSEVPIRLRASDWAYRSPRAPSRQPAANSGYATCLGKAASFSSSCLVCSRQASVSMAPTPSRLLKFAIEDRHGGSGVI